MCGLPRPPSPAGQDTPQDACSGDEQAVRGRSDGQDSVQLQPAVGEDVDARADKQGKQLSPIANHDNRAARGSKHVGQVTALGKPAIQMLKC